MCHVCIFPARPERSRQTRQKLVHRFFASKNKNRISVTMNVSHEISLLVEEIQRLGSKNANGQTSVKFGVLFNDDRCANIFEALVGTLKAAKKKKVVTFQGELLLQGVHDDVDVILLQE
ncbi:costars family protein ABRACL [Mugil cephalus]|uniref:costars family protein ABRACL n=1 Tax=Mugil cephalus TaxID=48193 RepID=UPI001FB64773|nr:costars family protein ABRACL [Mugil cephalus]